MVEKIDKEKKKDILDFLRLLESILKKNYISDDALKDEFEKHFNYICQGKDDINPFIRRELGITDEQWSESIRKFRKALNLEGNDENLLN